MPRLQAQLLDPAGSPGVTFEDLDVPAAARDQHCVVLLGERLGRGLGLLQVALQPGDLVAAALRQPAQADPGVDGVLQSGLGPRRHHEVELAEPLQPRQYVVQ